jgi:hypothetical protein
VARSRSDRWLVALLFYASVIGEVVAWIALGLAIVVAVFAMNPQLAHGDPFEDRWPASNAFKTPNASDAANLVNTWDVVTSGGAPGAADARAAPQTDGEAAAIVRPLPAAPPLRRFVDVCAAHHMHKVVSQGGKSWRCAR